MTTDTLQKLDRHKLQDVAATPPPVDTEVLLSHCMGNISFALALLGELEANGKQQVDAIALHVAAGDPEAVAEAAHSLKGGAAIIGAEPLRELAAEVEAAGRAGEPSLLLDMVQDLRDEMDRCLTFIPILRAKAVAK